ncbi:unnamed protein product [Phytophthora fragariaefolia]|uniref:Unnamed protein product n=1 Tax=Phytophthora fragariaefolia TaxID=1490495 RepID=A0A9W6TXP9_9STRA|nr:unnamed protein product [Phytophthora fragariaefolia]
MVRVLGSSGDSGSHRDSLEDGQVKIEQGDKGPSELGLASSELGSTMTRLNGARSTDRLSARRSSGTPVDLDPRQDSPTKQTKAGRERYGFADSMAKPERYISPSRKSTRSGGTPAKQSSTHDPDDSDLPTTDRAAMATMTTGTTGSTMIQRVRISAILDLKEFSGKDQDEDRAKAWLGKVKSAFLRDQASDGEKCLTFADLLSGAARNWYRQLPRSTRNKWTDLLRSFQIQYCGFGVSVARQYYHARKRSALEYLHRLNVAGLRARLKINNDIHKEKREHVDHFIETLGDHELADRLTLLRLPDADELNEVLRALDRAKNRQKKSAFGSHKFQQKAPADPAPAAAAKTVRAIQIQAPDSGSDRSDSHRDEHRRLYTAVNQDNARSAGEEPNGQARSQPDRPQHDRMNRDHRSRIQDDRSNRSRCTHCGSKKHTHLGCWKRLTCEKCGKRGHPAGHCHFVCRGCGELHDMGKCLMKEFYNPIRQWFNPAKHAGMLPAMTEKMLN